MEYETFVNTIVALCNRCKKENVSITWTIYPDYSEISVEPFQPVSKITNGGSSVYYDKGGPDE